MSKKIILFITTLLINFGVTAQNPSNCNCDYTVNGWSWILDGSDIGNMKHIIIHDSLTAANYPRNNIGQNPKLSLKGGDVICMDASVPFSFLNWENIVGTPENPVIIKNTGGQVIIRNVTNANQKVVASYGWKFQKSKYFKILGNGSPNHKYGFKITTHLNSYLQMIKTTSDFEIAHVEIAGDYAGGTVPHSGFAGIMAKSQPICWDDSLGGSTDSTNFELKNVSIHDNYIHDVGGEGMYIGYGRSQGDSIPGCSRKNFPHNIRNLSVYNNIVDNVGYDGIQIKNGHYNTQVYNNVIKNYGNKLHGAHDEGLLVGDGTEATIYGNWIENGSVQSNGMQINAFGNTKIYNNVILGSGTDGLYLNNQSPLFANRAGTFEIYNNTIEGGSRYVIASYTPQMVIIKNNILFGFGGSKGIKLDGNNKIIEKNIIEKNIANIGFFNHSIGDVRLNSNSSAIDLGENIPYFSTLDFTSALRIDGKTDIGAIEENLTIDSSIVNIDITIPSTNSITINPGQAIPTKTLLSDPYNKVKMVQYYLNNRLIGTDFMPSKTEHVIGNQHLLQGYNTFKAKATLYGGATVFSNSITIYNPTSLTRTTTSINENEKSNLKINYYTPDKKLTIVNPDNSKIQTIEIYNLEGKRMMIWENINNESPIIKKEINGFLSGIYLVRVKTNKQYFSEKILILP